MDLVIYYDKEAAGNPYFKYIYESIFERFKKEYPQHNVTLEYPDYNVIGYCPSCPGGISNLQIINPVNNKTILMSFWDRGMDPLSGGLGWEKYNIVQYIGGLGMYKNPEQIKQDYGITHIPFQYPLGVPNSYDYIDELRTPYDPEQKIRKAVFIGAVYGIRLELEKYFKGHPLIDWYDQNAGLGGRDYFNKLKDYRISLSLNGNGEFCLRDLESMGLNIPVFRSDMMSQLHNPLIPDEHYFKCSEACSQAWFAFNNIGAKDLAEQFISTIESNIDNYDKLKSVADKGFEYFDKYSRPDYIIDLFFNLVQVDELRS
jgi:hypothetical protein